MSAQTRRNGSSIRRSWSSWKHCWSNSENKRLQGDWNRRV
nr:unnamed protein product [Callosobruchus chinensis]